jgi:hypothetical protein
MRGTSSGDAGIARLHGASTSREHTRGPRGDAAQITALVESLDGGADALPRVYLDFLKTMGEHSGELKLTWGVTSASALLAEHSEPRRERSDPNRYFKFAIGEDDYNGRHPDHFFDLSRMRPDRSDAAVIQILENDLVQKRGTPEEPFASFSDRVRAVASGQLCLQVEDGEQSVPFGLGDDADAPARAYDFLVAMGFELTELGASPSVVVLEDPRRNAVAQLLGPSADMPGTLLQVRIPAGNVGLQLAEVLADYEARVMGLA